MVLAQRQKYRSMEKNRNARDKSTHLQTPWASLVAQMLEHLPAMQETWVQSLGREDPLEKEMATHSGILAWKIPWMEEPGGLQFMGSQRVGHDRATSLSLSFQHFASGGQSVGSSASVLPMNIQG